MGTRLVVVPAPPNSLLVALVVASARARAPSQLNGESVVAPAGEGAGSLLEQVLPVPCPHQGGSGGDEYAPEVCEAFCSNQCSFFNASAGEQGLPMNLTLYRMTPTNVTDAANKDLADVRGDIGFFLSRKTLRLQCALDPGDQRCFLAHNYTYASFEIEVDGRFGPYLMCNPAARSWGYDTSEFLCAVDCMTPPQCGAYQRNGTTFHGDYQCYCARTYRNVGRQPRRGDWTPNAAAAGASLPSQCANFDAVWPPGSGECLGGKVLKRVRSSHGGPAVEELLCEACNEEPACMAWTKLNASDGVTLGAAELPTSRGLVVSLNSSSSARFSSSLTPTCISARRRRGTSRGGGASTSGLWYGMGAEFGGYWYSLPAEGQCGRGGQGHQITGDDRSTGDQLGVSCSWRLVTKRKRVSAACLEGHLDSVVERWNARCFDKLGPPPVFRRGIASAAARSLQGHTKSFLKQAKYMDAYLECYLSAMLGDPAQGLAPLEPNSLVAAWRHAFESSVQSAGGCPSV